jgi:hypothetical protein
VWIHGSVLHYRLSFCIGKVPGVASLSAASRSGFLSCVAMWFSLMYDKYKRLFSSRMRSDLQVFEKGDLTASDLRHSHSIL